MANHKGAIDFITSAFDDYISARFLLINNYPLNGVILSSMAIEKYLKAFLIILGRENKRLHFDNITKLKAAFDGSTHYEIFSYIDPRYLDLLSIAYNFRYYDNIRARQTMGFAINQVIAELDGVINMFENMVGDVNIDGTMTKTIYKRAVQDNDKRVLDKNYLYHNPVNKKAYCEEETEWFGLHVDPDRSGPILIQGSKIQTPYNGRLTLITVTYDDEVVDIEKHIKEQYRITK
jgi:HEPN domain-containing protein